METVDSGKEKKNLREKILQVRESLSNLEVENKSRAITTKIIKFENFKKAKNIAIYYPFRNEVNVLYIMDFFSECKKFFFPVVDTRFKDLKFVEFTGKFEKNIYGIYEPVDGKEILFEELDLIIVPGVAFDKMCNRLGYGGGYYDKLLRKIKSTKCGVCYDIQIVEAIPVETKDEKVDYVISENYFIENKNYFKKGEIL
ncbi:MAG: 5-formyltetrahydrofolate cyclo-ligase [Endomicrobia bacterium]|nr:5-formyltetrahydrofolate cyclo-ligase [Endomicrobiia bacterium]